MDTAIGDAWQDCCKRVRIGLLNLRGKRWDVHHVIRQVSNGEQQSAPE